MSTPTPEDIADATEAMLEIGKLIAVEYARGLPKAIQEVANETGRPFTMTFKASPNGMQVELGVHLDAIPEASE